MRDESIMNERLLMSAVPCDGQPIDIMETPHEGWQRREWKDMTDIVMNQYAHKNGRRSCIAIVELGYIRVVTFVPRTAGSWGSAMGLKLL